jgi:hypothetical protein
MPRAAKDEQARKEFRKLLRLLSEQPREAFGLPETVAELKNRRDAMTKMWHARANGYKKDDEGEAVSRTTLEVATG